MKRSIFKLMLLVALLGGCEVCRQNIGWQLRTFRLVQIGLNRRAINFNVAASSPMAILIILLYARYPIFFASLYIEIVRANTAAFTALKSFSI